MLDNYSPNDAHSVIDGRESYKINLANLTLIEISFEHNYPKFDNCWD